MLRPRKPPWTRMAARSGVKSWTSHSRTVPACHQAHLSCTSGSGEKKHPALRGPSEATLRIFYAPPRKPWTLVETLDKKKEGDVLKKLETSPSSEALIIRFQVRPPSVASAEEGVLVGPPVEIVDNVALAWECSIGWPADNRTVRARLRRGGRANSYDCLPIVAIGIPIYT